MNPLHQQALALLDELPPPIAERAKRNFDPAYCVGRPFFWHDLSGAVRAAFHWDTAPEGFEFWLDVANAAAHPCPYPTVKGLPR